MWIKVVFLNFLEDTSPFCGSTDTIVLDFWSHLLWVSKLEWAVLFTFGVGIGVTCSLRSTSVVTPANLLAANMAADPIISTYLQPGIGGTQTGDLSLHR